MFAEVVFLLVALIICANNKTKQDKKVAKFRDQGAFLPTDYARSGELFMEYALNLQMGDGSCAPVKYREYLKHGGDAATEYAKALVQQQEIKEGRQPTYLVGLYNKYTFDPFARFHMLYPDSDIEDYNNRTGRWAGYPIFD